MAEGEGVKGGGRGRGEGRRVGREGGGSGPRGNRRKVKTGLLDQEQGRRGDIEQWRAPGDTNQCRARSKEYLLHRERRC